MSAFFTLQLSAWNSSKYDHIMFIRDCGRLMSEVGTISLQFFRTNRRHGSTSHSKRELIRSFFPSRWPGSVFIQLSFSGRHPIWDGST